MSQVRCQVQELRVVLLQEGSAAEDDIPEVQLQLARVRDKYFILTTAINISIVQLISVLSEIDLIPSRDSLNLDSLGILQIIE